MKTLKSSILFSIIALTAFSCDPDDIAEALRTRPDLVAESIEFEWEPNPGSQFAGVATITGTVRNIGEDFISREGLQRIVISEFHGDYYNSNTVLNKVAKLNFTQLGPNETLTITYTRNWNSSSAAEGEFPPSYALQIGYDVDIGSDDIPTNNDIDRSNDILIRHGREINDLIRI